MKLFFETTHTTAAYETKLQRYMYLSGNDKVVRGKKGSAGVHIFKTTQVKS